MIQKPFHDPVLKNEIKDVLLDEKVTIFVDGTLGLGGHAEAYLAEHPSLKIYMATDLDAQHLTLAKERLSEWAEKLELHEANFSALVDLIPKAKSRQSGLVSFLLDLGLCSNQLDDANKGFAFAVDGPLKMSYSETSDLSAEEIVNDYSAEELSRVLNDYGEEPMHRKIAKKIIEARPNQSLKTTWELRHVIESAVPIHQQRKTLTRVFQALRMEVNQELHHLELVLKALPEILEMGDRIGIISYHSLEDRMVKQHFKRLSKPKTEATDLSLHTEVEPAQFKLVTRRAIEPSGEEIERNPRSRSAKLRVIQKI